MSLVTNERKIIQTASEQVVLPSAAYTTTQTKELENIAGRGVLVTVDISAVGTGSITVSIYHKDKLSGTRKLLLASAVLAATATTFLHVFPGATASANAVANFQIGRYIEIEAVANNANPATYSIAASFS